MPTVTLNGNNLMLSVTVKFIMPSLSETMTLITGILRDTNVALEYFEKTLWS